MEATSPLPLGSRTSAAVCPPPLPIITHTLLCPQAAELVAENGEAYEAHMRGVRDYLEERLAVSARSPGGGRGTETPGTRHLMLLEDPSVLRIFLFQFTLPFTLSLPEYYKEMLTDKIIILWGFPGAPW